MLRVASVEPSSKTISSSVGCIALRSASRHSVIVASALYAGTIAETRSRTGSGSRQNSRRLEPLGILRRVIVLGPFLVVLLLDIDRPQVVALAQDILHREHRGEHRMILVVVAVHAIAADRLQVGEIVEPFADNPECIGIFLIV